MSCDCDFRRDLRTLKLPVGNKSRPEGSIAERYVANECLIFCARYLPGVETKENRSSRNNDDGDEGYKGLSVFSLRCRALSKKKDIRPDHSLIDQAHTHVLFNCDEVQSYAK